MMGQTLNLTIHSLKNNIFNVYSGPKTCFFIPINFIYFFYIYVNTVCALYVHCIFFYTYVNTVCVFWLASKLHIGLISLTSLVFKKLIRAMQQCFITLVCPYLLFPHHSFAAFWNCTHYFCVGLLINKTLNIVE